MMTVSEVSRISGVSVRTLHHYDSIGLLRPPNHSGAGYRLYDDAALQRLQLILLFKELELPLKDIAAILDDPEFDRKQALSRQIGLLQKRREHLDALIALAGQMQNTGEQKMNKMDFKVFNDAKMDAYAARAKKSWGGTDTYREYEQKSAGRSRSEEKLLGAELMEIFAKFGEIRDRDPGCAEADALAADLQNYISSHYYTCTDEILASLGRMYAAGGEMTENIDRCGGEGTAVFAAGAIEAYIEKHILH